MKSSLILLSIVLMTTTSAQVITPAKYDYEKASWGDHLTKTKKQFSGKNIAETRMSDNPFAKKMEDKILYGYTDSINSQKVGILFQFSSEDSTLQSIFLAWMKSDPNKNEKESETKSREILDSFTKHFPSEFQERSIPLMGTVRMWTLDRTSVQAYLLPSMISLILMKK